MKLYGNMPKIVDSVDESHCFRMNINLLASHVDIM